MVTNNTTDDLNLNSDPSLELTNAEQENLQTTTQENVITPDVDTDNKTVETTLDENGQPIETKELTEEEQKQFEADAVKEAEKQKQDNDLKAEREKFAKIESENYNNKLTQQVLGDIRANGHNALSDLVANKSKFERVINNLANNDPDHWVSPQTGQPYTYKEFTQEVETLLENNAKTDPNQLQYIRQLDQAKTKAELENQLSAQEQILEIKYSLKSEIPEFAELLKSDSVKASQILEHALNTAGQRYGYMQSQGIVPTAQESEQMIKEALYFINPSWLNKAKSTVTDKQKSQTAKILNQVIQGTSTSTNSNSGTDEVKSLTEANQVTYKALLDFYGKRGYSADEAHRKAIADVR